MGLSSFRKKLNWRLLPSRRDGVMVLIGAIVVMAGFEVMHLIHDAKVPVSPGEAIIISPWIPATVKHWQTPIDEMAKKYDVDPNLIAIIMTLESGGFAKADSGEAQGLMQITPRTAKDIATKYLKKPIVSYNLFDPTKNIEFGTAYLAYLRDQFGAVSQGPSWDATVELVAAGYNGGPGAASSLLEGHGLDDAQTVVYFRDAFNMWRERHAATSPTYTRWLERGGSSLITAAKLQ